MKSVIVYLAVGVYTLVVLAIGYVATRNVKSTRDYLIAGKKMGFWLITCGVVGTIVSGAGIVGLGGSGYGVGYPSYVMIMSGSYLGLVAAYFFLAKPMSIVADKYEAYTLPDVLSVRYGHNSAVRGLSALAVVIGCFVYLVSQFVILAWVGTAIFGWTYSGSILAAAVLIGAYTIGGGMLAAMWTNLFQMIVLLSFVVAMVVTSVGEVGGLTQLHLEMAKINPDSVLPWHANGGMRWQTVLSYAFFVGVLAYAGVPHVSTKFLTVKSAQVLKWVPFFSIFLYLFAIASVWTGMAGRVLVERGVYDAPTAADQIIPHMVQYLSSPFATGLMLAAVMAAVMDNAASFLILPAAAIVRDVWKNTLRKSLTGRQEMTWTRVVSAIVLVAAAITAMKPPSFVLLLMAVAWGAFAAMLGPVTYLGLRWKRATTPGAIASLAVGIAIGGVIGILNATVLKSRPLFDPWNTAAVGVFCSYLTLVIVSLATKAEPSAIFSHFPSERVTRVGVAVRPTTTA